MEWVEQGFSYQRTKNELVRKEMLFHILIKQFQSHHQQYFQPSNARVRELEAHCFKQLYFSSNPAHSIIAHFPICYKMYSATKNANPKVQKTGKEMRKSYYRLDLCSKSFFCVGRNLSFLSKSIFDFLCLILEQASLPL